MMSKTGLVAFALFTVVISGCSTTTKPESAVTNATSATTTGYWYLGDNGERQWRTLNPADIPAPAPAVRKNYASAMGNGSGRG
ncbi:MULTISPECIES: hypothetical protein [Bartonella]|uniref:Lipoprotein n=1 Tax=Bartonella choladocola TaxID=2750995 RepID=A0A1U9MIM2_9HYPH|nr:MULTISPECIES: hypothetical protein [Bartonella]AQT47532.1 hypothetical protein BBC0122_014230 [Bartonella choladocola]MBH9975700.1 hypothetical protein [Bartonella choladocola]MBI0015307.1 hypothetical protein [Bartonella sp. B10834G3]MBI0140886.1 hypothetical protein [Bartonella choladocola]